MAFGFKAILQRIWYDNKYPRTTLDMKIAAVLAETFGSMIYIYIGCMANSRLVTKTSILYKSVTFGLGIMISTIITLPISGAHLNPVVTLSAWILGTIHELIAIPLYMIGQIFGALIGAGLARASLSQHYWEHYEIDPITNRSVKSLGLLSTSPNPHISHSNVFLIEFMLTFILILTYACMWEKNYLTETFPLKIGFTVICLTLMGESYSGASMNPARTFGMAILNFDWYAHWIYWIAPYTASVIASFCWKWILSQGIPEKNRSRGVNTDTSSF